MRTLVERLCALLKCTDADLTKELTNPESQAIADGSCSRWYMETNYKGCFDRQISFMSLGEQAANIQKVFDGHLDITVQQYIFCRWRKTLTYPHLPCVIEWHPHRGLGTYEYFPLECINVCGVKDIIMEDKMFEP